MTPGGSGVGRRGYSPHGYDKVYTVQPRNTFIGSFDTNTFTKYPLKDHMNRHSDIFAVSPMCSSSVKYTNSEVPNDLDDELRRCWNLKITAFSHLVIIVERSGKLSEVKIVTSLLASYDDMVQCLQRTLRPSPKQTKVCIKIASPRTTHLRRNRNVEDNSDVTKPSLSSIPFLPLKCAASLETFS